jgi:hypothetical protein
LRPTRQQARRLTARVQGQPADLLQASANLPLLE